MAKERFFLPSGASVKLGGAPAAVEGVFARELAGVELTLLDATGNPVELRDLPLADFHVLRAILRKLGRIAERELPVRCSNCGTAQRVLPCAGLELGPFRDDELDDPELDVPFDFDRVYDLPPASSVRLAPRTLGEAAPFHRALRLGRPLRFTSAVVRGMGVVELDGEQDVRRIARALANAPDTTYDALAGLFEDAHYPRRLDVPHPCRKCGATIWVLVPSSRELSLEPDPDADAPEARPSSFMDVDAFERLVREEARAAYAAARATNIDLEVVEGAAEVDDGGEPLLGCYRPPDPHALVPARGEIRIFYRTFANMYDEDGPYDVRAEVRETLRHELEHHTGHLLGSDPLDDEEHAEIEASHARRVGRAEARRRAVRAAGGQFREFWARTWFVWLLVLVASLLALWAESR